MIIDFVGNVSADAWVTSFGTLMGAFLGASLAGIITINSIKRQLKYDSNKNKNEKEERNKKLNILLKRFTKEMLIKLDHIDYLVKEVDNGLNLYEVPFKEDIDFLNNNIQRLSNFVNELDIDIVTIEKYEDIQELIFESSKLQHRLYLYNRAIGGNLNVQEIKNTINVIYQILSKME